MIKKLIASVIILTVGFLSGCSYDTSLENMSIVMGMSVDRSDDGGFIVNYETIDVVESGKAGVKTKNIESKGRTLTEAAADVKKVFSQDLFFANMEIVLVSRRIAEDGGIPNIVDWLIREDRISETVNIAVADEDEAKSVFALKAVNESIKSYEYASILKNNKKTPDITNRVKLYELYNYLTTDGKNFLLPCFKKTAIDDGETFTLSGNAVFSGGKMKGVLDKDESSLFIYLTSNKSGGYFVLENCNGKRVSFDVIKSRCNVTYKRDGNNFTFNFEVKAEYALEELGRGIILSRQEICDIENAVEAQMKIKFEEFIRKIKTEYKADIFGLYKLTAKTEPDYSKEHRDNWNEIFEKSEIVVGYQAKIVRINESR